MNPIIFYSIIFILIIGIIIFIKDYWSREGFQTTTNSPTFAKYNLTDEDFILFSSVGVDIFNSEFFEISNPEDLVKLMGVTGDDLSKIYVITETLDMENQICTPIGSLTSQFTGILYMRDGFEIKNMEIEVNVPKGSASAGLVGYLGRTGKIINVKVGNKNTITATSGNSIAYSGGICGGNVGSIINCSIGDNNTIIATSPISADESVAPAYSGGICGENFGGSMENFRIGNNNTILAKSENSEAYSGSICGRYEGSITDCTIGDNNTIIAISTIFATYSGGIFGRKTGSGSMTDCTIGDYNIITAKSDDGNAHSGGICGSKNGSGSITECTIVDNNIITAKSDTNEALSGGICGLNVDSIEKCSIGVDNIIVGKTTNLIIDSTTSTQTTQSPNKNIQKIHDTESSEDLNLKEYIAYSLSITTPNFPDITIKVYFNLDSSGKKIVNNCNKVRKYIYDIAIADNLSKTSEYFLKGDCTTTQRPNTTTQRPIITTQRPNITTQPGSPLKINCPQGTKQIETKTECEKAAVAMDVRWNDFDITIPRFPSKCYKLSDTRGPGQYVGFLPVVAIGEQIQREPVCKSLPETPDTTTQPPDITTQRPDTTFRLLTNQIKTEKGVSNGNQGIINELYSFQNKNSELYYNQLKTEYTVSFVLQYKETTVNKAYTIVCGRFKDQQNGIRNVWDLKMTNNNFFLYLDSNNGKKVKKFNLTGFKNDAFFNIIVSYKLDIENNKHTLNCSIISSINTDIKSLEEEVTYRDGNYVVFGSNQFPTSLN
jgi:hypothetical protein